MRCLRRARGAAPTRSIGAGADPVFFAECPVKIGIVAEAAVVADRTGTHAAGQHLLGLQQALEDDIAVEAGADRLMKLVGEVVFADVKSIGKIVQGDVFAAVLVDISKDTGDEGRRLMGENGIFIVLREVQHDPVQLHHQLRLS